MGLDFISRQDQIEFAKRFALFYVAVGFRTNNILESSNLYLEKNLNYIEHYYNVRKESTLSCQEYFKRLNFPATPNRQTPNPHIAGGVPPFMFLCPEVWGMGFEVWAQRRRRT